MENGSVSIHRRREKSPGNQAALVLELMEAVSCSAVSFYYWNESRLLLASAPMEMPIKHSLGCSGNSIYYLTRGMCKI